jgi:hypothetical protein
MCTRIFSGIAQPSSKTRLPIRTPSSRQMTFFIGVPLNRPRYPPTLIFQNRSCHQK